MPKASNLYWRLAPTEAGLAKGYLFRFGLYPPNVIFNSRAVKLIETDATESEHGYTTLTLFWDELDAQQLKYIQDTINNATGKRVYITYRRTSGAGGDWDWVDAYGEIRQPDWRPGDARGRIIYTNVELEFGNLTTVNDPASF